MAIRPPVSCSRDRKEQAISINIVSLTGLLIVPELLKLSQNSGRRLPESRVREISESRALRDSQPADYRFEDFPSTPESSARRSNCHKAQSRPILAECRCSRRPRTSKSNASRCERTSHGSRRRSEEHTSELQSQSNLVCRLLLEKKT